MEDGEQLHRALVDHALLAPEARQAEDALGHVVVHLGVHGGDDVLLHREVLEQADVLEGTRDARAVDLRGVETVNVPAVEEDGAVRGLVDLREQVEDGRLARAVGADEARDLRAADGDVEAVDRLQAAEGDAEVDALEDGRLVRVALRQQRRLTGNGNELCFLRHSQTSFSSTLCRRGSSFAKNALNRGLLVASITKMSTMA